MCIRGLFSFLNKQVSMASEREKFLIRNTLISLLKAVEGQVTTVELRNENIVIGKIENVDSYMNILMKDVVFKSYRGTSQNFSSFFVQGTNIRYVQIPDEIDMREAIDYEVNKEWQMKAAFSRRVRKAAEQKISKRQLEAKKKEARSERQTEYEEKKKIPEKT
jgi:small nuclear ribonucleoprotein (snRNP)-like protein